MSAKLWILFWWLTLWVRLCSGQGFDFTHYQVENGLSNNAVICSAIDSRGFMWFGTKDGLNRFDGYTFKVFKSNDADSSGLGNSLVSALFADDWGDLWVGTEQGVYRYDAEQEKFYFIKGSPTESVDGILMDRQRRVWFITGGILYCYNTTTAKLTNYKGQFAATAITLSPGGALWVATIDGHLKKYIEASNGFTDTRLMSGSTVVAQITRLYADGENKIWVGTSSRGAFIFDNATQMLAPLPVKNADGSAVYVRDFIRVKYGELWIATESGIFIYNDKTGKFINLRKSYSNPYSITDNATYTFCIDCEGGVWVGTYFGGVNYYAPQFTPFQKYAPKEGENAISGNAVREICADEKGNLWIGTEDAGLNKFNPHTGLFTNFKAGHGSISTTNIHGLMAYGNQLWIGTFEHGLDIMDLRTQKLTKHLDVGSGLTGFRTNFIHNILRARSGKIYLATPAGLHYFEQGRFYDMKHMPPFHFCTCLAEDSRGRIWVGTYGNGVYCFDETPAGQGSEPLFLPEFKKKRVTSIFEDSDKNIWIATEAGLYKYVSHSKKLSHYSVKQGLPSNLIYSLLEDSKKQLWISTSKGLVCFNRFNGKMAVYTRSNGLLNDQFNYCSAYKDSAGTMYFGSVKGLISFKPETFKKNTFDPPVYITGFQVNNRELKVGAAGSPLKQSILVTSSMVLNYNSSSFNIAFSAIGYASPATTQYAYKMDGLDKQWTYINANRRAYFTELPAGKYVFRVKAANAGGRWSSRETLLHIEILPPWWKSPWAYTLYATALLVLVLWLIYNYNTRVQARHNRQREAFENEKEKEVYEAKIEFFTNVAHEIRTPLTLIKGPLEKLRKRVLAAGLADMEKGINTMHRNTERLLMLTNQLLDFRATETSGFSLNFVQVNVGQMVQETLAGFAATADEQQKHITVTLPDKALLAYVDTEGLTKILINLIDNAIKYSRSAIRIQVLPPQANSEEFSITVASDGRLLDELLRERIFEPFFRVKDGGKKPGTGIGLSISRTLAELHKGSLKMAQPQNEFNIFVLTLPVHQLFEFNLNGKWKNR